MSYLPFRCKKINYYSFFVTYYSHLDRKIFDGYYYTYLIIRTKELNSEYKSPKKQIMKKIEIKHEIMYIFDVKYRDMQDTCMKRL